jgi:hypothetical protein
MSKLIALTLLVIASPVLSIKCDLISPDCVEDDGDGHIIDAKSHVKGLRGHWSFDDSQGLDSSGKGNHAVSGVTAGPAQGGLGTSASFTGYNYMEVPHHSSMNFKTFTVSFWLYLHKDGKLEFNEATGKRWCPIF